MATKYDMMAATARMPGVMPPPMDMPGFGAPADSNTPDDKAELDPIELANVARMYMGIFDRYKSERLPAELRWLRNLRQYMGVYDAPIENMLPPNRSRAYPRMTRTKCLQLLARIMSLMFPGNDKNWTLTASPSPDMDPIAVADAVATLMSQMQAAGMATPLTQDLIDTAVNQLAATQAEQVSKIIDGQLNDLGSSDPEDRLDWIALNRKVLDSGIKYGIGVLEGPWVKSYEQTGWKLVAPSQTPLPPMPGQAPQPQGFVPVTTTVYKPSFEFLPVWDFYPDMTARTLPGEGYFVRKVMSAHKLKKLRKRPDFQAKQIDEVLRNHPNGNYSALSWETELRALGVSINADRNSNVTANRHRYEIIVWRGPIDATMLAKAGVEMDDSAVADDMFVEMWICAGSVIKLEVDPWRKMGNANAQVHVYCFDEDDTSPIGQGLPYVMRDSQMSVCAATRMLLDNASVVCGPQLEVNKALLDPNQDMESIVPYKMWVRMDEGATAQFPAVREINIDAHLPELQGIVEMFSGFADSETFLSASTGGEMSNLPSEPMRTMAGASMVNGNVALPFKDAVRAFDTFTQSVIHSLLVFNQAFNEGEMPKGQYNVIARGATSLIAKEVRGAALDNLAQTITPDEAIHVDSRKLIEERLAARDVLDILKPQHQVDIEQSQAAQQQQQNQQMQDAEVQAGIDKTKADAYKSATQGQKNVATAQHTQVKAASDLLDVGATNGVQTGGSQPPSPADAGQQQGAPAGPPGA